MGTNRIDYSIIQKYLDGRLDTEEVRKLEREAEKDPFLADALEGYVNSSSHAGTHLSILQRQLEERIDRQQENKNTFFFTWQRLSIAAAAGLLFIAAAILFWMKSQSNAVRNNNNKQIEVQLTPADQLGKDVPEIKISASIAGTGSAAPVIGWEQYNKYLKENLTIDNDNTVSGRVSLVFRLGKTGEISDLKVEKGLNKQLDKELLQLIKAGPGWKLSGNTADEVVRMHVNFGK